MNWMFSKYTYPASGRVDLRELLCPHCGLTNITEILLQNEELLRERAGGVAAGALRAMRWAGARAAALYKWHEQERKKRRDYNVDRDAHSDNNLYSFEVGLL